MTLSQKDWQIEFFERANGRIPVQEYIESLNEKYQAKIFAYIELLRSKNGRLYEPYAKHIKGPLWELRVDFGRMASRVFYFLASEKKIILLHAFMKKTNKTPSREIEKAEQYYHEYEKNH